MTLQKERRANVVLLLMLLLRTFFRSTCEIFRTESFSYSFLFIKDEEFFRSSSSLRLA